MFPSSIKVSSPPPLSQQNLTFTVNQKLSPFINGIYKKLYGKMEETKPQRLKNTIICAYYSIIQDITLPCN